MKCRKCHADNSHNAHRCYKCNTSLSKIDNTYSWTCPLCLELGEFPRLAYLCSKCIKIKENTLFKLLPPKFENLNRIIMRIARTFYISQAARFKEFEELCVEFPISDNDKQLILNIIKF